MDLALPIINFEKCSVCGDCVEVCPTGALEFMQDQIIFINPNTCSYCTLCEQICPQKAIRCEFTIIKKKG